MTMTLVETENRHYINKDASQTGVLEHWKSSATASKYDLSTNTKMNWRCEIQEF